MKSFTIFLISTLLFSSTLKAILVDTNEINQFEYMIRMAYQVPRNQILSEAINDRISQLRQLPDSAEKINQIADYLHIAGHLAEHKGDYKLAIQNHKESMIWYRRNTLPIRGSWDGIEHGNEHIFMNLFDLGYVAAKKGDMQLAVNYFNQAYSFSKTIDYKRLMGTPRFPQRYLSLIKFIDPPNYSAHITMIKNQSLFTDPSAISKVVSINALITPKAISCSAALAI